MGVRKIHYKDDFELTVKVIDARGRVLPIADGWDFAVTVTTSRLGAKYKAGRHGGVCTGCHVEPDGSLHVMVDNHNLIPGKVSIDVSFDIPQSLYPDGAQHISVKCDDVVELVYEKSDLPSDLEIELQLPTIKGDPFTFADFTPEQIDDLKRPATEAAADLKAFEENIAQHEQSRERAEQSRVSAEQSRQKAEDTRATNELTRESAEHTRTASETEREKAERNRAANEQTRISNESTRQADEQTRITAETDRNSAEQSRQANEQTRIETENTRQSNESTRKTNEQARIAAETTRNTAEQTRQTNESTRRQDETRRQTAEQERQTAETTRNTAEQQRNQAETRRAEEFASWQTEIDSKAPITQLSNILSRPLSGTPQQPEPNIPRLFIDQWNTAWRQYGRYDPDNAPDLQHPFMGNDIWMTYEEALETMNAYTSPIAIRDGASFAELTVRTLPPIKGFKDYGPLKGNTLFYNCIKLEVVQFHTSFCFDDDLWLAFNGDRELRHIRGQIYANRTSSIHYGAFKLCEKLETIFINGLKCNISFADSPKLSLASMQYMIEHAANTSAITITVHPDIYARLTDTANTEWHPLLTAAAARQITFATV